MIAYRCREAAANNASFRQHNNSGERCKGVLFPYGDAFAARVRSDAHPIQALAKKQKARQYQTHSGMILPVNLPILQGVWKISQAVVCRQNARFFGGLSNKYKNTKNQINIPCQI